MIRAGFIILILFSFLNKVTAQADIKFLEYKGNGNIVFDMDSLVFVFKAKDYLKMADLIDDSYKNIDSVKTELHYALIDTLKKIDGKRYSLVGEMSYLGARYFPNHYTLKKLFKKRKIDVYRFTNNNYIHLKYFCELKHGKFVRNVFVVKERKTKKMLFKTSYGGTRN
jgi:hypothetical protein